MLASRLRVVAAATAVFIVCTGALTSCAQQVRPGLDAGNSRPRIDLSHARPASYETHGSVQQIWLTGAAPGEQLQLVDRNDRLVTTATADAQGSLIFRDVDRGRGYRVAGNGTVGTPVDVLRADEPPASSFYASQQVGPGYGYLQTRDGTLLAMNVTLPGPPENGPYPTVIEYSGYSPANPGSAQPSTLISRALGYATVGVNIRGTGCSGGAFTFFEALQGTDGYDIIETIAAQPWVAHGKVGMVGLSYPGISQLFTAARQPPHLAAIAPLSVIADTGRGTLRPGGILNDGFALSFARDRARDAEAAPASGQGWAGDRIRGGDAVCASNQILRSQASDLLQTIADNPYWNELAASLAPELFVDRIEVPVFLAGAWHDEQTGAYFANMLDDFTGTDKAWFSVTNGGHTEPFDPAILSRWIEFLQIYVAQVVPKRPPLANVIAQVIGEEVWESPLTLPPDRFANATSLEAARATFEADPRLRVLFENGAGDEPGLPYARFESGFARWPVPGTQARAWYFDTGSALVDRAPRTDRADVYTYDPSRSQSTTLPGTDTDSTWLPLPAWQWTSPPAASAVAYETAPLASDTVMVGTGSVDLWVKAEAPDVDLQVTISEVRPDGQEVLVQSGWLRASQRQVAPEATALRPLHTDLDRDVRPLRANTWNEARVEIFPFGHAFRAGSKVRVVVDTPGGTRPRWQFDVLDEPAGTQVQIGIGADHASRVVLPVVPGVPVPPGLPACPSLRGQPCRPYQSL